MPIIQVHLPGNSKDLIPSLRNHIENFYDLYRPTDIAEGHANLMKAFRQLGWKATATLEDVVKRMVDAVKNTR